MASTWFRLSLMVLAASAGLASQAQLPSPVLATRGSQGDTTGMATVSAPVRGISEDGRFVVMETQAINLAPGITDRNLTTDVYLLDRDTNSRQLVSRRLGDASTTASGQSFGVDMTPDGRWILFRSSASDVVPGVTDNNGQADVFLFDRVTLETLLVSRSGASALVSPNASSFGRGISDDGRFVLFESDADNIAAIDTNTRRDLFLFDRLDSSVRLVSHVAGAPTTTINQGVALGRLSADGAWVLYGSSSTNIAAAITDTNGALDAWLWSRDTGAVTLVSRSAASATATAAGSVSSYHFSNNADWVTYDTTATDVLAGVTDNNLTTDVYRYERATGTTTLVSASAANASTTGNQGASALRISNDGSFTTFYSAATDAVSSQVDTNNAFDIFVRDHGTGNTLLASRADDQPSQTPSLTSTLIDVTADGRYAMFYSQASNIGGGVDDSNGVGTDVFVFDRVTQTTRLVSHRATDPLATPIDNPASFSTALTDDGRWALFYSTSKQLVNGVTDHNNNFDVFLKDLSGGALTLLSRSSQTATNTPSGNNEVYALSAAGRWLLFGSFAPNVFGVTDAGTGKDLFLFDRDTQATILVSRRNGSPTVTDNTSGTAVLSSSGNRVAYNSRSLEVIAGLTDTNNLFDLFVFDRTTQSVQLVSAAAGQPQTTANGESYPLGLNADGRYVLFQSFATNLIAGGSDTNNQSDVFRHDTQSGTTILVSRTPGNPGQTANNRSDARAISADGRWIVFSSTATNLISGVTDTNNGADLFLFDADTGTTTLITRASDASATANGASIFGGLSPDGEWTVFETNATNLITGTSDFNGQTDVYRYQRSTGILTLISFASVSTAATGNNQARQPMVSIDGRFVAYSTSATGVAAGITDSNSDFDAWLYDGATGTQQLISTSQSNGTQTANAGSVAVAMSEDGTFVVFRSLAGNLAQNFDLNNAQDAFVHHVPSRTNKLLSRRAGTNNRQPPFSGTSLPVLMSKDAGTIVLLSDSTELVSGINDGNGAIDLFLVRDAEVMLSDGFE